MMLIAGWLVHGLVALVLVHAGGSKIVRPPKFVVENLTRYHLIHMITWIGWGEFVAGVLLAVPYTSPLGVLVASAIWGGAIVAHMSHGERYVPAAVFMLMTGCGAVLKYAHLFEIARGR